MRILMQSGENGSLAPSLAAGLADADCELQEFLLAPPPRTMTHRIVRRFAPSHAYSQANCHLLREVEKLNPDVLWIFKGMEIYPETLRILRERGITLVNYNADHPFNYFSSGSGNNNVRTAIPEYHLHLTYSRRIARDFRERYPSLRVAVIPFGHAVSAEVYDHIRDEQEVLRACFLGNPDEHRRRNIERLAEAGVPTDVYGHRWDRFLKPSPLLRIHGQVVGNDMLRTLRRYRLQLNFFRPHNADSHNMRTFEVPACGGIMLAEDSVEHREFFECCREAFFFSNAGEMINQARELLAMSKTMADAVRTAARQRCIRSGYSYRDRAHLAFGAIAAVDAARRNAS